jgi:hypothetical protein
MNSKTLSKPKQTIFHIRRRWEAKRKGVIFKTGTIFVLTKSIWRRKKIIFLKRRVRIYQIRFGSKRNVQNNFNVMVNINNPFTFLSWIMFFNKRHLELKLYIVWPYGKHTPTYFGLNELPLSPRIAHKAQNMMEIGTHTYISSYKCRRQIYDIPVRYQCFRLY